LKASLDDVRDFGDGCECCDGEDFEDDFEDDDGGDGGVGCGSGVGGCDFLEGITGRTGSVSGKLFRGLPFLFSVGIFSHFPVSLFRTLPSLHFKTHLPVLGFISLFSGHILELFLIIHLLFRLKKIYIKNNNIKNNKSPLRRYEDTKVSLIIL
jgi:hypothetical protein